MAWKKLGKIFEPNNNAYWLFSHASNPFAELIEGSRYKIYFSSRDNQNRAYIGYLIVDMKDPFQIIEVASDPLIDLGEIGAFDDNGMSMACTMQVKDKKYLYYLGWNLANNVPFKNSIGVIQASDKGGFERFSKGPMMDRDLIDPFSLSYPYVIFDEGVYKMWYGSHKKWGKTTSDMIHCLKYAESNDGIHWNRTDKVCIDTDERDYAFSRPCIIKHNDIYKMWYSFRGGKYRIGYAESKDGTEWHRKDQEVGITVSQNGWDSEMICYPHVFKFDEKYYMLYNGNSYGKTGFGIAVLQ